MLTISLRQASPADWTAIAALLKVNQLPRDGAREHLSTFGGNPVSCAAGVASIGYMLRHDLPARATRLGNLVRDRLHRMQEAHSLIGEVRGLGLMIGVELVMDRATKQPAAAVASAVRDVCRQHGVLIGVGGQEGNVIRLQPPLVIEESQLAVDMKPGS